MVYFPYDKYSQMFWGACVCRNLPCFRLRVAVVGNGTGAYLYGNMSQGTQVIFR